MYVIPGEDDEDNDALYFVVVFVFSLVNSWTILLLQWCAENY